MSPRRRIWLLLGLVFCLALGVVWALRLQHAPNSGDRIQGFTKATLNQLAAQLSALEARENEIERTVWTTELMAQQCGAVFDALWDSLNNSTNKLAVLGAFPVRELTFPVFGPPQSVGHAIELYQPGGATQKVANPAWRQMLNEISTAGWTLVQGEIRHDRFETNNLGKPSHSSFYFRADLVNPEQSKRSTLAGDIQVSWATDRSLEGLPLVDRVDASGLRLLIRPGIPPFQPTLCEEVRPFEKSHFIDPLILYDLDGDGLSEIILAASNLVFKRQVEGGYSSRPFCQQPQGLIFTGAVADFDGDGTADFLGATFDGLVLFRGSRAGTFEEPGRRVWTANPRLKYAQVLTCGDIDHDGDLDIWLGQYKNPYDQGQMPTPYYNANDGNPAYLLVNNGRGDFTEATDAAGLGPKRWRRSYSGSLVDLNGDHHLDLLVVSDFAGVDVYVNDGQGHFTDVTEKWLPEWRLFGMAHTLADFDRDGYLDFLAMGMHCPTAQRLDHLGLKRPGRPDYEEMRPRMTAGNRLFMGKAGGGYRTGPLGASIRHSGWSWGCSAFDWDNDGFPDVCIANGHETRQSVMDYEPEFWLHDIYVGNSRNDLVHSAYFGAKSARTRGRGYSYGGYEKNRLFLNQRGESFLDVGHLLGVALEQDSRNLMTDDLDGDGRVDLLLTTFEAWPRIQQTLQVFRNNLETGGHWIGFRLREQGDGVSPVGATVTVRYGGKNIVQPIVTGDSHRSQRANTVHFGLGQTTVVESAEIRWLGGRTLTLEHPAIDRYHAISLPR